MLSLPRHLSDEFVPAEPQPFIERRERLGILFREYPYHVARAREAIRQSSRLEEC